MKPEDLKYPFTHCVKRAYIYDRIWFTGEKEGGDPSFIFPGWESESLFGNKNPVFIEYCSGNGLWIAAKAEANPQINWVAVELKFSRVRKIWSKIKNLSLPNLIVIYGEGYRVTHSHIPSGSVEEIYINFPDPWPKRRHARNRLIQKRFVDESLRVLNSEGKVTFVTDDEGYSEETIAAFAKNPHFSNHFPAPFYSLDYLDYGTSYFEDLWRELGKPIRYHVFKKIGVTL